MLAKVYILIKQGIYFSVRFNLSGKKCNTIICKLICNEDLVDLYRYFFLFNYKYYMPNEFLGLFTGLVMILFSQCVIC